MKDMVKIARMLALFGQLGFTVVTPPVVLALLAHWLQKRFSLGSWIMLAAIALGLVAAGCGVWQYYRRITAYEKKQEKEQRSARTVFYHHE